MKTAFPRDLFMTFLVAGQHINQKKIADETSMETVITCSLCIFICRAYHMHERYIAADDERFF